MKRMTMNYLGILFLFIYSASYGQKTEIRFQRIVDSTYQANQDAVGIMIHVETPEKNIS